MDWVHISCSTESYNSHYAVWLPVDHFTTLHTFSQIVHRKRVSLRCRRRDKKEDGKHVGEKIAFTALPCFNADGALFSSLPQKFQRILRRTSDYSNTKLELQQLFGRNRQENIVWFNEIHGRIYRIEMISLLVGSGWSWKRSFFFVSTPDFL